MSEKRLNFEFPPDQHLIEILSGNFNCNNKHKLFRMICRCHFFAIAATKPTTTVYRMNRRFSPIVLRWNAHIWDYSLLDVHERMNMISIKSEEEPRVSHLDFTWSPLFQSICTLNFLKPGPSVRMKRYEMNFLTLSNFLNFQWQYRLGGR